MPYKKKKNSKQVLQKSEKYKKIVKILRKI